MADIGSGIKTTSDLVWWSQMTHKTFLFLTLLLYYIEHTNTIDVVH